ncbi:hypothetical protein BKK79_36150 [Cupriavidus sp. USMAA2-4]|nr:hypothetical protein BKK79_36150 [Cupriavidus sp. USMAA2-4]
MALSDWLSIPLRWKFSCDFLELLPVLGVPHAQQMGFVDAEFAAVALRQPLRALRQLLAEVVDDVDGVAQLTVRLPVCTPGPG